ncbi:MAG: phosphate signaling complex protein PhoU [Kiritimatiellae bacterium]|nr:phosphate signaling complex protein PhoU [Kiritimatiellia bacterium]MDD4736905.1 phosphate signaling complex protein PhoU [Kiritimatiellia bacterium]
MKMKLHFNREIEKLKKLILTLAAEVETNLRLAVESVMTGDADLALKVIEADRKIDHAEVDVEEECLKILALHQPVANDLRYVVAILKINHDLERIGDLAVNIAEYAHRLAAVLQPEINLNIPLIAEKARHMVSRSIDALINLNAELARITWLSDDEVDDLVRTGRSLVESEIGRQPEHTQALIALIEVIQNLERIADHSTNISKDVIYLCNGEIVRHRSREFRQPLT